MAKRTKRSGSEPTKITASYKLSRSIKRRIDVQAATEGVKPCVVAERLLRHALAESPARSAADDDEDGVRLAS